MPANESPPPTATASSHRPRCRGRETGGYALGRFRRGSEKTPWSRAGEGFPEPYAHRWRDSRRVRRRPQYTQPAGGSRAEHIGSAIRYLESATTGQSLLNWTLVRHTVHVHAEQTCVQPAPDLVHRLPLENPSRIPPE